MIIDMRSRPPFGCFLQSVLFDNDSTDKLSPKNFSARFGMTFAPSAREKSMELYLREMAQCGITKAVVPMRRKKDEDNDTLIALFNEYPDTFLPLAGIDPLGKSDALAQIKKYVLEGPCRGIIMEPAWLDTPVQADDALLYIIYNFCEEHHIPVCLSFGGFNSGSVDYNHPEHIYRIAKDFPQLHLALCHAAWPWVSEAVHLAYRFNNIYLSPDIYVLNTAEGQGYIDAANYMLYDKIMYGSAYPIVDMAGSVAYYTSGKIHAEHLPEILYGNAQCFLNLV